jgi:16S rRNA (guanine966-N2)-methyltransferase
MSPTHQKTAPPARGKHRSAHAVRIIGGQWKRTPITVAAVDGLRPTPDRVRETVFNWLTHQNGRGLEGLSVLDLFAGTGALGFEAASRGAARVVLVETARPALAALFALKDRLSADMIEIKAFDARAALERFAASGERFDVVFLDPPFREGWIERVLVSAARVLTANGLLYIESEAPLDAPSLDGLGVELVRKDKAGQVFYHLLRKEQDHEPEGATSC